MSDSEDKGPSEVPAWQKAQSTPEVAAEVPAPAKNTDASTLEQAKKFLQDPEVQKEIPKRKAEFLSSKGIPQSEVDELLRDEILQVQSESQTPEPTKKAPRDASPSEMTTFHNSATAKEDRPPIVTYPEFLTKSTRPPPLMSMNGFLNTIYAFGGVSALIYGTSKFVLEPMVESLTEARVSLHDTANQNLIKLVEKLENTVSEIPPTIKKPESTLFGDDGNETSSSYDDPTELFHRDIGVQTSIPSSPIPASVVPQEISHSSKQASRITNLVSSLKSVQDGIVSQTEDFEAMKVSLDAFRDDLDQLSSASTMDFAGGYSLYGNGNRNEPDDEIKKAKENIRRVKGVLLTTRSFPASVR